MLASARAQLLVLCTFAALCAVAAVAQKQTYKDPTGTYSVTIPKGWESEAQPGSPMVSIVNPKTKVSVTLGIMHGPQSPTPTPESQLQKIESQFPQNCPQARIEQRGQASVAGMNGVFVLVHCQDQSGPQTMRVTAATKPGYVAMVITNSPGNAYLKELLPLEEIHSSFKILTAGAGSQPGMGGMGQQGGMGNQGGMGQGGGMGQQGGMDQAGMSQSGNSGGGFSPNATMDSGSYHDPQGRYSLAVPQGWNTASDNGNLTLSSGNAWVSVATGTAGSPSEESHSILQQIEGQYKSFQILNQGDFQNNGHPAHGTNATGVNPKGQRVSLLVVSIGAGNGNYLVLISSAPNEQAKDINATVMQIAQSVRFGGE